MKKKAEIPKKNTFTNSTQPVLLTFEENRGQCK